MSASAENALTSFKALMARWTVAKNAYDEASSISANSADEFARVAALKAAALEDMNEIKRRIGELVRSSSEQRQPIEDFIKVARIETGESGPLSLIPLPEDAKVVQSGVKRRSN